MKSMTVPFKKDPVEFNQRLLFPSNIFDLLPEDHECYIYGNYSAQCPFTSINAGYFP